ncbi:MAG: hypothetical protein ACFFDH_13320 [Promethearchaeota archaeon]
MVTFRISLSQNGTTLLTASSPVASYTPPSPGLSRPISIRTSHWNSYSCRSYCSYLYSKKRGRIGTKMP